MVHISKPKIPVHLWLKDFYKQAQSTEFSSLVKKMESEKKLLLDQLEDKNEVIKSLNADHRKEIEKLKVQLYAAKMTDVEASSNSLSTEFYRKKILSLQELPYNCKYLSFWLIYWSETDLINSIGS